MKSCGMPVAEIATAHAGSACGDYRLSCTPTWRRRPDSHRGMGLCGPLANHFVTLFVCLDTAAVRWGRQLNREEAASGPAH